MDTEFYEAGVGGYRFLKDELLFTDQRGRPHTILTFIALEQHKKVWRWLNEESVGL